MEELVVIVKREVIAVVSVETKVADVGENVQVAFVGQVPAMSKLTVPA